MEFKHIASEFIRVALTRPETGFSLTHNGKDVYVLKAAKSLKFRIQDVLGGNIANELVDIRTETSVADIRGFVGRPDAARKGLGNQFFFVNGRYFRSPFLHKAVMKAYENLITEGTTPTYIIYMEVNPQSIDVNIHPTKTEIKFEEDSVLFQILYAGIKESLGRNSFGDSIDFDRGDVPEIPVFGQNFEQFHTIQEPQIGTDANFNPFNEDGFKSEPNNFVNSFTPNGRVDKNNIFGSDWAAAGHGFDNAQRQQYPSGIIEKRDDYGKLFEDKISPSKAVLTLQGRYIITAGRSGLMVINISRAMERILYDRFLNAISKNGHITQTALFPVTVQIGVENMYLVSEHSEMLSNLGFDIAPFGIDTIVVNGVPEGYSAEPGKVQTMIGDLMLILSEDYSALPELMAANMASKFAKLGALGCDTVTNPMEAQRLIEQLFACENAEYTSTGRRVMSLIPIEEIDKKF